MMQSEVLLSQSQINALFSFYNEYYEMSDDLPAKAVGAAGTTCKSLCRHGFLRAKTHITHLTYEITEAGICAVEEYANHHEDPTDAE